MSLTLSDVHNASCSLLHRSVVVDWAVLLRCRLDSMNRCSMPAAYLLTTEHTGIVVSIYYSRSNSLVLGLFFAFLYPELDGSGEGISR